MIQGRQCRCSWELRLLLQTPRWQGKVWTLSSSSSYYYFFIFNNQNHVFLLSFFSYVVFCFLDLNDFRTLNSLRIWFWCSNIIDFRSFTEAKYLGFILLVWDVGKLKSKVSNQHFNFALIFSRCQILGCTTLRLIDWIGSFYFSDKSQPRYSFDYTDFYISKIR